MTMAHELNVENGNVSLAYAGPTKPWHGLGTSCPGHLTAREALIAGRLDWNVRVAPLRADTGAVVPNHYATIREDTGNVLGVVKGRYTVVQNEELSDFLSGLFGAANAVVDTVGALRKGSPVWFMAKIPHATMEVRPGDPVEPYFLCVSTHDGTGAVKICFASYRTVCANTLAASLRTAKHVVSIRHTKNVRAGLGLAAAILAKSSDYWTRFRQVCEEMAKQDVTRDEVRSFLSRMFPGKVDADGNVIDTPSVIAARSRVQALFDGAGDGASLAGATRWGLLNAVSQWVDRDRPIRGGNTNRWVSSNFGGAGENLRQKSLDLLLSPSLT
jgi:phage/plasmid-like protein (TIGR03299 family)